jgi:hypothetical protein
VRGGFRKLINEGSAVSTVDLEVTRPERDRLHEQVRLRNHLLRLLAEAPVDEGLVRVTPFKVVDGIRHETDREVG